MGFGKSRLKYFLLWVLFYAGAETRRASEEDPRLGRQFRPTRRVLEPLGAAAAAPDEGLQESRSFPEEGEGDRRGFLIQEDIGILTKALNDEDNSSFELGSDILGARKGARFFRHEERGVDGRVKGQYGFVDANGDLHVIAYVTDSLGHRIRTETHKIDGYGHELTKILESGPSTAEVKDHINRILSEQYSQGTTSETAETTGKPEITTAGLRRTTRSTNLPSDQEPYFDDEEPDAETTETFREVDTSSPTLSELAKFAALVDQSETRRTPPRTSKQIAIPKSLTAAAGLRASLLDDRSDFRRTNSHTTRRFPPTLSSTLSSSARSGNSRVVVLQSTPRPDIFTDISSIRKFGKDLSSSQVASTHPVFAARGLPLNLNVPTPQSNSLSQEQQRQIRDYLDQILRGSGTTNIDDDADVGDIRELDAGALLEALETIIARSRESRPKNIAVITLPERIIQPKEDSHIIHGEVIDGGIINAKEFISEQINRNKNLINGGIIDGGIINDDIIGDIPKDFNSGNIVNGGIIDGGILDDSVINGGIINGGFIGIEQFTKFGEPTTPAPFRNRGVDKERLMNLMALQKLLSSDNAETFISLLNIERVVQSDNIDSLTKTMILDRMLESDDAEIVAKVLKLKRLVRTNTNDQQIMELLKKEQLADGAETNREQIHQKQMSDSFTDEKPDSMHEKSLRPQFSKGTDEPLSKSEGQLENDTENLPRPEKKDKTLNSEVEMKETKAQESKSIISNTKNQENDAETSEQPEDHGKDINSDSVKGKDSDIEVNSTSPREKNEVNPNVHQDSTEVTPRPTVIKGSDAIRIIPSPDLSTGRPGALIQRFPVFSESQRQRSRPNTDSNVDYDAFEGDNDGFALITPLDQNLNPQANWAVRPFSIASLAPHRSPVFINSTVYVTTTAAPSILGFEGSQPRLIRPDLTGTGKSESSRPLLNRPRLNNNNAPSTQTDADLQSEVESQGDENPSSINVSKDEKETNINSSSTSSTAKSQEQPVARTIVETHANLKATTPPTSQPTSEASSAQPAPTNAPASNGSPPPPTYPTTPAPVVPVAASPPTASPYPKPYQLPNDPVPGVQGVQINTLPALPPIIENLPPIHVTTVIPPTFHHHHQPHLTTPLPYHKRGFSHSPFTNVAHFHQRVHTRHGREFPLHPRNLAHSPPSNDLSHDLTHDRPPPPRELPKENQGDSSRGQDGSHGQLKEGPFIPIHTSTHTISSGPHHVFIQKNLPRHLATGHSVRPTGKAHRIREATRVEDIQPVLHDGPSLIPTTAPAFRRGRALSQRLPTYGLRRRHGRRAANRRMGSGLGMW
ncbi:uncharacterized protein LOC135210769 [Macrobrachium nipponense]|uniref:uncharacterized protein LOC135210769 n=1 Tax=Macrobrachium nipponense TaxID=159736 RepID=UPI0030C7F3F6